MKNTFLHGVWKKNCLQRFHLVLMKKSDQVRYVDTCIVELNEEVPNFFEGVVHIVHPLTLSRL